MPFHNRVDPFGVIHATPSRGLFTGNRGIIHDPATRTLLKRRWSSKAWIVCDCGYRNRKRDVMGANGPGGSPGWTNLFFLDEVTALAAGHRPCFTCRRAAALDYAGRFGDAHRMAAPKAPEIDAVLHGQRLASGGAIQRLSAIDLPGLPDGAVVSSGARVWALRGGRALPWFFAGYGAPQAVPDAARLPLVLVTPAATVAVLRVGYTPLWHPRASN